MTTVAGEGGFGLGDRIGTMTQVRGAIARMRAGGWPLAAVGLGLGSAYLTVALAFSALGVDTEGGALTPGYLVYSLVVAVAGGVGACLAYRLMLFGRAGWLRIDRGFLECVGILAVLSMAFTAITLSYTSFSGRQTGQGAALILLIGLILGFGAAVFLSLRLTLWPMGRLFGRAEMTPARSMQLMRKATRGLFLGLSLFGIPFAVVLFVATPAMTAGGIGLNPATVAMQYATAAYMIAGYALSATLYDLRVGRPSTLADVFA